MDTSGLLLALTDLGDSGLLTALLLAGVLYLMAGGHRIAASMLLGAFFAAVAGMAAVKLLFLGCEGKFFHIGLRSPSGHAALSASVYSAYALLLYQSLPRKARLLPVLAALPLIGVISASRVWLGFHTAAEVALGLAVGMVSVALSYGLFLRGKQLEPFRPGRLAVWLLAAGAVLYGFRLPVEPVIRMVAILIRGYNPLC